jgi:pyruvate/2-oxoglutarate dehydrogenase complex dihydrolipoamide dehydrogenase (E3) component
VDGVRNWKEDKKTKAENLDVEASFDSTDLEALTARVKQVLDIRDRKYGFPSKTYPQCFVGREAVVQLVEEGIANDEEDAVHIGKTLTFAKAVVATGGTAAVPNIAGLQQVPYLTNATIFKLTELPIRLGVIGAGPIGIELAQAFQRFGSQVAVFSRSGKILPKEDLDAAKIVENSLGRNGVTFAYNVNYKGVESRAEKPPMTLVLEDGSGERNLAFDAILVAAGRKPAVQWPRLGRCRD